MKAVVFGATGETGRRIVQALVDRQVPVRAVVRDLATARAILPDSVEVVQGNLLDRRSIDSALAGCTVVLSAAGARPSLDPTGPLQVDYLGTKNLTDAAKAAGIEQLVLVSSLCVSKLLHPLNLFWLILFWKQQGERYLQNSGLTYTIVRPGGLKNEDRDTPVVMSTVDTLFEGSIPRSQVAKVCVEALWEPAARNKIVEIVARDDAPVQPWSALFASV
ncbi:SDR family oxidoreductase [Limnothrix sp. FACHB-708]|uniref:SDR family oxidoreductase n=1 Tax=unclassified Limnothrix TaxID=2632864 RepID=UPI001685321B|nr:MULTISPECIES: SDR family oxidoreductase [unclassified Limnothrix]MBD2553069.1 SDR family oxidoreductase [Limnothrix sp. FACHB-708]MBD2589120.1 SDR family oxidoreductase [Limnothrix sp. FACHB-406]